MELFVVQTRAPFLHEQNSSVIADRSTCIVSTVDRTVKAHYGGNSTVEIGGIRISEKTKSMHSILIVEDDMNINGLLKEAFEKQEYVCTQAFSGTEARMPRKIFVYVWREYRIVKYIAQRAKKRMGGLSEERTDDCRYFFGIFLIISELR